MVRIKDLGIRIELLPEDRYFRDISIALYGQTDGQGSRFLVHSYASHEGTAERIEYINAELQRLGGLERVPGGDYLRFPCGSEHHTPLRRLFYRVCRRDPSLPAAQFSLTAHDSKADCDIVITPEESGRYRIGATTTTPMAKRRIGAARNGLIKWTQMIASTDADDEAAFACGMAHDDMVAMLLRDALNVRGAAREQDALRSGGVLNAPGRAE